MKHTLKRSLAILLVLLVLGTLAGCQPKLTATETYERILKNSMTNKQMTMDMVGTMSMDLGALADAASGDPTASTMAEMFKNIGFKANMQYALKDKTADFAMTYDVDLNGMAMHIEAFFDGDQVILKYPLMPQYLVLKVEEVIETINESTGLTLTYEGLLDDFKTIMVDWYPKYMEASMAAITPEDLTLIDNHTFKVGEETYTSKALQINFSQETFKKSTEALVTSLKDSEALYNVIKKYDTENTIESFEVYQETVALALEELMAVYDSEDMASIYDGMTFNYVIGYDKKYQMNYMDYGINMVFNDPTTESEVTMSMAMAGVATYDPVTINFPELTDTNQLNIMDFMDAYMPALTGDLGYSLDDYSDESMNEEDTYPQDIYLDDQIYLTDEVAIAISENPDPTAIEALLLNTYNESALEIQYIYFADAQGKMLLVPDEQLPEDYDASQRPWYMDAVDQGMSISDPYQDAATGLWMQSISQAIYDGDTLIGVLGIDFIAY